jgi:hypothetical protein
MAATHDLATWHLTGRLSAQADENLCGTWQRDILPRVEALLVSEQGRLPLLCHHSWQNSDTGMKFHFQVPPGSGHGKSGEYSLVLHVAGREYPLCSVTFCDSASATEEQARRLRDQQQREEAQRDQLRLQRVRYQTRFCVTAARCCLLVPISL